MLRGGCKALHAEGHDRGWREKIFKGEYCVAFNSVDGGGVAGILFY
jgi:hypothetical protein